MSSHAPKVVSSGQSVKISYAARLHKVQIQRFEILPRPQEPAIASNAPARKLNSPIYHAVWFSLPHMSFLTEKPDLSILSVLEIAMTE